MKKLTVLFLLNWFILATAFSDTYNISNVANSVATVNFTNNIVVTNTLQIAPVTIVNTNNITNQISAPIIVTNLVNNIITNIVGVPLPQIPPTGTNVLKAVNGELSWIAE